jgi:hypothetical protein
MQNIFHVILTAGRKSQTCKLKIYGPYMLLKKTVYYNWSAPVKFTV